MTLNDASAGGRGFLLSVPTLFGLESLAAREIRDLGYETEAVEDGRVSFWGDAAAICRANLWLRTAERVQIKMGDFSPGSFDDLFERTKALPWPELLPPDAAFPVKGHCLNSKLASVPDCQSIIKKAIVESMKRRYQTERFSESGALFRIQFNIIRDRAAIYVDTTGEGLHKRGYREDSGLAPIKETLAAALVMLSGWRPGFGLWDPFCGSGTIAIEAALMAARRAPGAGRRFCAEEWAPAGADGSSVASGLAGAAESEQSGGAERGQAGGGERPGGVSARRRLPDASDWARARAEAAAAEAQAAEQRKAASAPAPAAAPAPASAAPPAPAPMIFGSDIERRAVEIARKNAARAGVAHLTRFAQIDAKDARPGCPLLRGNGVVFPERGCLVCNPPYGERIDDAREAARAVASWGPTLRDFPEWNALAISAAPDFEKTIGKKADKRRKLYNGMIKCQSYVFYGKRPQRPTPPKAGNRIPPMNNTRK